MFKTAVLVFYNFLRIALGKITHPWRFMVAWIQRISPACSLRLSGKGVLEIGRNCDISRGCDLGAYGNGLLRIGDGCYMGPGCIVSAHDRVEIGRGCLLGPGVRIFDNNHKHSPETGVSQELTSAPVTIGEGTWLCSNVIVLKGSRIGRNCVIGAGCVIKGDVPDGAVVSLKQELEIR